MDNKKLHWCFRLKDGIRIVEPNERLAQSYIKEAKSSLERAEKNFSDGDLLWASVVIYYSDYYALYSFLQKIGVKCENHSCSILVTGFLLGEDKISVINQHKNKRIDAQYYMKVGKEKEVRDMLKEAKMLVLEFDEFISNLNNFEIKGYRSRIK
ncbi:HEPN domain-containing protein [Candidatus Woesearchaeota archaeon]|nr:HEPN domain-containing protein [Candidatus Woesearchaeota archaeon]